MEKSDFEIEAIKLAALNADEMPNRVSVELTEKQANQIRDRSEQLKHESAKTQGSDDRKKKQLDACWDWKRKNSRRR